MNTAKQRSFRRLAGLLLLLCAFVLFNMPTMMIGDNLATSSSSALVHDIPNSVKSIKRMTASPSVKLFQFAALLSLAAACFAYPPFRLPSGTTVFCPFVFLKKLRDSLMPLKFTTSYAAV